MPLLLAVLLALLTIAAPAQAAPTERPLVYAVSVDGLDGDAVTPAGMPFLSSLLAGEGASATTFLESRSVIPAETNPNHTAMATGAYPGASGIAANAFAVYAPLADEDSCTTTGPVDTSVAPTPTSGESATCLQAETIFEAIKRQGNPDDLISAGIFGKPKLGRIFAGRADGENLDADHLWAPCASGADDDDYCEPVSTNPITGYAANDQIVMDEVIRTVREGVEARGETRRPDFTFVNLPQVDSAGHISGRGLVYDLAVAMADAEIERLVTALREEGVWERAVLVVLSDHSMDTTPSKVSATSAFEDAGIAADRFVTVQNGSMDFVYLADRTDPQRFELLKRMRTAALAQDGVTEALYRRRNPADGGAAHTIGSVHPGWRTAGERTGDLVLISGPGTAFSDPSGSSNPLPGNHGAPQTRDNTFVVVGGGGFVRQQVLADKAAPLFDDTLEHPRQAENVDLAPTAMGLLGLAAPSNSRGRFLANAFDIAKAPGRGRPTAKPGVKLRLVRRLADSCKFKLALAPKGARFDVRARKERLRDVKRTRLRLASSGDLRVKVRLRSASGATGPWRTKRARC